MCLLIVFCRQWMKADRLTMKLKLRRTAKKAKYTIGHLYRQDKENGQWVFVCDTIEDRDRGLDQSMTEANITAIKVKHETAIPTGTYEIDMDTVSGTFVKKDTYKAFCGTVADLQEQTVRKLWCGCRRS